MSAIILIANERNRQRTAKHLKEARARIKELEEAVRTMQRYFEDYPMLTELQESLLQSLYSIVPEK